MRFPKDKEMKIKHTRTSPVKAESQYRHGRYWKEFSMFKEQAVNGKPYPKNTERAAVCTSIFRNGKQWVFLRNYRQWHWKNMIKKKESVGNGRAWRVV